jgi:thiamine thiazole synthase
MHPIEETAISEAIISSYHRRLLGSVRSDVIIVGAGPSGLVAAHDLARSGMKVILLEKRLSPGGGIWGGAMGMNEVVIQDQAVPLLDEFGVTHHPGPGGLHTAQAAELACGLCLKAIQAGATFLNLITVEDVSVHGGRVTGVVINRTTISGALHVDPMTFAAGAVIDATGHEAIVVAALRKRGLLGNSEGVVLGVEGPMNAEEGERFVVDRVQEVFPGLWVSGMSVCATLGGPRMGPIFGGMLLSGRRVAELVAGSLA